MARVAGILCTLMMTACDSGPDDEAITAAVEEGFARANPAGQHGLLMKGRTGVVWWQTSAFTPACLEQNDLAFNDDPTSRPPGTQGIARISPTYKNQWTITAATDTGYCIDLGSDPKLSIGEISPSGDGHQLVATITMGSPTKWFECLRSDLRERVVEISVSPEGAPIVETDLSLFQGDCPHPLPASAPRLARAAPTTAPSIPPTAQQIQQLASAFDAALTGRDGSAARELVSCYNLYEEKPYGACSVAEIIPHGAVQSDEADPWLEYAAKDFAVFGRVTKDREDPTIYHVPFKHRRSGETRSISVQWVDNQWKLLGIVSRQSAKLTVARILNDLHERDKRDIFRRRLAGEEIDDSGQLINPEAEEDAPAGGGGEIVF